MYKSNSNYYVTLKTHLLYQTGQSKSVHRLVLLNNMFYNNLSHTELVIICVAL